MGIYQTPLPCGCVIEHVFGAETDETRYACVEHGGNPVIVAGRQARAWAGPANPYADPAPDVHVATGEKGDVKTVKNPCDW